jgi:hypothetical protein
MTMRSIRTILALAAICGFAAGSTSAQEDTFYFDVAEGDWETPTNWDPQGTPTTGDTAIIQDGQHCHVQTASQDCKIFKVLGGGLLTIEAPYYLRVGSHTEHTSSVVGGDVHFLKQTDGYPMLVIREGGVTLTGDNGNAGTLNASAADGLGKAYIGAIDASTQVLEVGSGIEVKGSYLFYAHIDNNGTFVLDDPNDTMTFRKFVDRPCPKVGGTGTFDVSAGTLTFDNCILKTDNSTTWDLSGTGTIHITTQCFCGDVLPYYTACAIDIRGGERLWVERATGNVPLPRRLFRTTGQFSMSDGTLDIDGPFKVSGGAALSGGTIEVAPGESAEFRFSQ